jgi:hypothetical protein
MSFNLCHDVDKGFKISDCFRLPVDAFRSGVLFILYYTEFTY